MLTALVDALLTLRYDSLQIVVTHLFKQRLALSFDVLSVNNSFWLVPLDQFPQAFLPFDKREIPQFS